MTDVGQTTVDTAKRQVAKHSLLDAAGQVVEEMEKATAARYQDIETGKTFDYTPSGAAKDMLALFGARTLMTNEASAVRNGKESGDGAAQMEAIAERFAGLDNGVWVDRTREGVGVKVDKAVLASAAVEIGMEAGKIAEDKKGDAYASILKALEEGKPASGDKKAQTAAQAMATIRAIPGVQERYAKLQGKTTRTIDDLSSFV